MAAICAGADADDGLGLGDGFMSPLPNAQAPGIAGLGDMQADMMTPNSPYALNEIMGSLGADGAAGDDTDNNMKNKWGFTPGADDTLNVSHGRALFSQAWSYMHVFRGCLELLLTYPLFLDVQWQAACSVLNCWTP